VKIANIHREGIDGGNRFGRTIKGILGYATAGYLGVDFFMFRLMSKLEWDVVL